ncbi:1-phosphatidylinositol-4-phosphate 5-kinase [Fusarium subglutinans]|uniref:1-phosphatidylinositol-4-phosphate 5-kinase n=1 Tax=Gibberella subglutinans TaxID=42677 RepID=A0A8H5V8T6_GIBSU|nr:1-phosphatidylinositol-4-phosphate 5-kinase [Fusarium subglutinans]KAF5613413.1 1-phosphatidylinositol-4-phosphate 5-kinase [Fusarium subglutinans]
MPSFLSDQDNSTIFSNNPDILNLDPTNQFGFVNKERVNGGSIRHTRSDTINESFDESSISTHASDVSDSTPAHMNGNSNSTRPTSMSSNSNGMSATATHTQQDDVNGVGKFGPQPMPNGTANLVDRTRQHTSDTNGINSNTASTNNHQQNNILSKPLPSEPQTTDGTSEKPPSRSFDGNHTLSLSPFPVEPRGSQSQTALSANNNTNTDTAQALHPRTNGTHRLSSPPIYNPSSAAASSTGHLQAPPCLKQRHTLDVPKYIPGRGSKDGMDTAQASGRFSPTNAGSSSGRRPSLSMGRRPTRSMQSDGPRDEIVPDEDALRWAEALRQKRASKRRRKEEEDDDRVLVGTKVDENHANWETAYNMLTGIRVSVSRTNAKLDRELTDADFETKQKSTFDIAGNELVPSAKYDFKFKDYAPWVFRRLRALFRLDPADYLMSLTGKYILSELGSPGKSGSFFYFSRDYKYIIKTIHHAEHKFLRKILKEYYQHVKDNPNMLLSQFYGLHRVKMPYGKKIHFVVMNNLFPPHRDIHTTFDLKGSTIGRDYREEDLEKNPRATLKDLNWLRRQRSLELGIQKKRMFLEQLQRDVALLKRLKIMDYSLLVGIHDVSRGNEENLRDKTLQVFNPGGEKSPDDEPNSVLLRTPSKLENQRKARELRQMIRQERPVPMGQSANKMPDELQEGQHRPGWVFGQDDGGFRATHEDNTPGDEIYYLGVIDCLTHYGIIKKIEHFWKGLSSDKTQISALPPDQYGDRFYHFIEGVTMSTEEAHREAERRHQEMIEAQRSENRVSSWNSRRRSSQAVPPMPTHVPPPPPGPRSPEAQETLERAHKEAERSERHGHTENQVPDRVLTTGSSRDNRDSLQHEPILPVVQEAGENGRDDTEAKLPRSSKDLNKSLPPTRAPPPTPPKSGYTGPGSADSGYAGLSNGTGPVNQGQRVSIDSLNKELPPLPRKDGTDDNGVRLVA